MHQDLRLGLDVDGRRRFELNDSRWDRDDDPGESDGSNRRFRRAPRLGRRMGEKPGLSRESSIGCQGSMGSDRSGPGRSVNVARSGWMRMRMEENGFGRDVSWRMLALGGMIARRRKDDGPLDTVGEPRWKRKEQEAKKVTRDMNQTSARAQCIRGKDRERNKTKKEKSTNKMKMNQVSLTDLSHLYSVTPYKYWMQIPT